MLHVILVSILLAASVAAPAAATQTPVDAVAAEAPPFDDWMRAFLDEARQRGFSDELLYAALRDVTPLERVIKNDRTQAESTASFERYLASRVTPALVRRGRELARQHAPLLGRIARDYGVPSRFLLAIWGVETRFGRVTGKVPIFQALATLAWEPRRADFFRGQLFDALTIAARGYIDVPRMKGSWAGAMGQPQFMPSSYLGHAVDFDGDGHRDIWQSTADVLASIANYLKMYGWQEGQTWGRKVKAPPGIGSRIPSTAPTRLEGCSAMRDMTERVPLAQWKALGVTRADGTPLPESSLQAGLVQVGTQVFVAYENYDVILGYNCAHFYALSVAMLADRLR